MPDPIETHSFTTREVLGAMLPEGGVDCDCVKLKTKQGVLTIEVHAPAPPKGGELSRRAAMLCGQAGFHTFLEVSNEEKAKETIYEICGVTSRSQLDHDDVAAAAFRELSQEYEEWAKPPF